MLEMITAINNNNNNNDDDDKKETNEGKRRHVDKSTSLVYFVHFNLILVLCRDDGFLKRIQSVKFSGVSRDPVSFDSNGNGVGTYDITVVNKETEQWEPIGSWISNTSNVLDLPSNVSLLDLNLTKLGMFWQKVFDSSVEPTSFCGQQCPPGHLMLSDERHQVCFSFCLFFFFLNFILEFLLFCPGWDLIRFALLTLK